MTSKPEQREQVRIIVQTSDQAPRKRTRHTRKNLHEPCPGQFSLFDPENPT